MGSGSDTSVLERKVSLIRLESETQKLEFKLGEKPRYLVGREKDCDIQLGQLLLGGEISRKHAEITKAEDGKYQIRDLGSKNGTYVNEQKIDANSYSLKNNDKIRFSRHISFVFKQGLN